jgi:hypothetical protein
MGKFSHGLVSLNLYRATSCRYALFSDLGSLGFHIAKEASRSFVGIGNHTGRVLVGFGPASVRLDLGIVQYPIGSFLCDGKRADYCTFRIMETGVNQFVAALGCGLEGPTLFDDLALQVTDIVVDLAAVIPLGAHGEVPEWELAFCHGAVLRHASLTTT